MTLRSPFSGLVVPGRCGRRDGPPGVVVSEMSELAIVSVASRPGREKELAKAANDTLGAAPDRMTSPDGIRFVGVGPGQWLALAPPPSTALRQRLASTLGAVAALSDQSHSRGLLRMQGPRARDALAKGCSIDLDPTAFRVGSVAVTTIAHIDVTMWQVGSEPTYELAVPRSCCRSFWKWLNASSAEFGLEVQPSE